ncbi:AIPR family protein [Micromonospora sp. CA-259024]|uniref:AIPR family protein n=1 Tax=Micromonospora sp. CA-259024 TaxID=3239965 RepID=UPI003D94A513
MSVVQVRFVQRAIEERFGDLIDLSDVQGLPDDKRKQHFLTRGLAALARQVEQPCGDAVAAQSVFDGIDDRGLDAISIDRSPTQPRIRLYQSKWSDGAKGGFGEAEVHKMIEGLDLILDLQFPAFNRRFQRHVDSLEQAFEIPTGTPKIILVLALLRTEPLSAGVRMLLEKKIAQYNRVEEMVDYKVLDLRDFHRAILGELATPKIDISVRLEGFGQEPNPYKAMYGTMTVPDVADLFTEHRRGLFARNIRDSLDSTDVNVKIRNTLLTEPENFWYFSNGITMLCQSIKPIRKAVPGGVGEFQVTGVSVVNGAQTVTAIHKAYTTDSLTAERGRVMVRLISLEDCPPGFGDQVTTSTNTQNPIEDRDFKSLDPVQITLRDEFATALSLSYVLKRGEPLPESEHGTSITEVAEALAATHINAEYAALAKRDVTELWQDGVYENIFGSAPSVHRAWRCVQLLRAVRLRLTELREGFLWRAAAMAGYGDLLVTHVVFQQLNTDQITSPDSSWEIELAKVADLVERSFEWSLQAIDAEYGTTSHIIAAVRNTERIQQVASAAIRGMTAGHKPPTLRTGYRIPSAEERGRQVDVVKTLVAAKHIADGTMLEFRPVTRADRRDMADWLAEKPSRSLALWRNSARDQLQWQEDLSWHSPSGLVRKMRKMASGKDTSVQGTLHWHVPNEGSLKDIADNVRAERDVALSDGSEAVT